MLQPENLQYLGPELWDVESVPSVMERLGAELVTPAQVADLLAAGNIIGVVRGRTEFGPRAVLARTNACKCIHADPFWHACILTHIHTHTTQARPPVPPRVPILEHEGPHESAKSPRMVQASGPSLHL